MNVLIVDDIEDCHEVLINILTSQHPDVNVIGQAFSVGEGYNKILALKPDLIFLDIDMPDGTGFDLLEKFEETPFIVIFVTGHNDKAISAIRAGALDYILKPPSPELLATALSKAKALKSNNTSVDQVAIMMDALKKMETKELPTRVAISTTEGINYIFVKDIIRLEAHQNYTMFYLNNDQEKILASVNIGSFHEQFHPYTQFMKVHRSHLVNLTFVQKYSKVGAIMQNGDTVPVARNKKDELLERMSQI